MMLLRLAFDQWVLKVGKRVNGSPRRLLEMLATHKVS